MTAARLNVGPQCHGPTELVNGAAVYPSRGDLAHMPFWQCRACGAFVGCHPGTTRALGKPATKATRRARKDAHDAFDRLWRGSGASMGRAQAYAWLSREMGIDPIHIGDLDAQQCARVVHVCLNRIGAT